MLAAGVGTVEVSEPEIPPAELERLAATLERVLAFETTARAYDAWQDLSLALQRARQFEGEPWGPQLISRYRRILYCYVSATGSWAYRWGVRSPYSPLWREPCEDGPQPASSYYGDPD